MRTGIASVFELKDGDIRLDASYYASEGNKALRSIQKWLNQVVPGEAEEKKHKINILKDLCKQNGLFIPGRFKRVYVNSRNHGDPWVSPTDMQRSDLTGFSCVSRKYTPSIEKLRIHSGWILLSRSGTIGNLVYVREDMDSFVGSDDIIRIINDPGKIQSGYLLNVLNSPLFKSIIQQKAYGAVVPHIEVQHIEDIPVPRLGREIEEKIHTLVTTASRLKTEANQLLETSRATLLAENNLPRLTREEMLTKGCWTFETLGSQIGKYTLTAWTYNPVSLKIIKGIQSKKFSNIGDVVKSGGVFRANRSKRIDADKSVGIMMLSQADVFQERPDGRWVSSSSFPNLDDYKVPNSSLLIAAQGTMGDNELFGRCQFSHRNFDNCIITEHILRIYPDPEIINPGYLYAFLSSEYGFQLIRSTAHGTIINGIFGGLN